MMFNSRLLGDVDFSKMQGPSFDMQSISQARPELGNMPQFNYQPFDFEMPTYSWTRPEQPMPTYSAPRAPQAAAPMQTIMANDFMWSDRGGNAYQPISRRGELFAYNGGPQVMQERRSGR